MTIIPGQMKKGLIFLLLVGSILIVGCGKSLTDSKDVADDRIFIQDQTGKKWDVTHAVQEYGMDPDNFNFGLGPDAIPPIVNPVFLVPGDAGYPSPSRTFQVVGVTVSGESRAYPVSVLTGHEVVNDRFGSTYVAVTY